jgi:heme-degrading monooxygenase HmoA
MAGLLGRWKNWRLGNIGANHMIVEMAVLNVIPGEEHAFEKTILEAEPLIAATQGFGSISVRRCIETPNRYLLLVTWRNIEDHITGFRRSDRYEEWRKLLHHFYDPFPTVEHYEEPLTVKKSN